MASPRGVKKKRTSAVLKKHSNLNTIKVFASSVLLTFYVFLHLFCVVIYTEADDYIHEKLSYKAWHLQ